jgi:NADH-quinone oxidoreductase subunit H
LRRGGGAARSSGEVAGNLSITSIWDGLPPAGRTAVLVVGLVLPLAGGWALGAIYAERRLAAFLQSRLGPNRVGPFGLLQSLADGIKLIGKEDLCPAEADRWLFRLAPYLAFVPVFVALGAVVPFAGGSLLGGMHTGAVWISAVLAVEVMGVLLGGWGSNNKWSVYGAMREACQMISYELPLGLSVLVALLWLGTVDLTEAVVRQSGGVWHWTVCASPWAMGAFVMYFVASLASNKRAPFDLPEADSELVGGYHTEYSGLRFSFFYFAEYLGMWAVSAVMAALFLGGWEDPLGLVSSHGGWAGPLLQAGIFGAKTVALVGVQMWVRWSLPRPRIDQVLYVCLKVMLPVSVGLLVMQALWQAVIPREGWVQAVVQVGLSLGLVGILGAIIGWIGWAKLTGGSMGTRLSEASAIRPVAGGGAA